MNRVTFLFVAAICGAATVGAHPDHNATQRTSVTLFPTTEAPPGSSRVSITIEGDTRIIMSNGLPDHPTGRFPNASNPNSIREQNYRFTMPAHPSANKEPTPLRRQPFGIAVNGVLFDPGTAEAWHRDRSSGWNYDALGGAFPLGLDTSNAHVQPNGAYHYHGVPALLLQRISEGNSGMTLIGWAADGFPIYAEWAYRDANDPGSSLVKLKSSYRLKSGDRPTSNDQPGGKYDGIFVEDFEYVAGSGDLDECGGRFGVSPEYPDGTYYYVLTADFPFVPRAFRGTPDASFAARRGPGEPGGQRPPMRRPSPS
jgi:hypothetical protein